MQAVTVKTLTYEELLALYPENEWVDATETEDEYCATCARGEICREGIACDVSDVRSAARRQGVEATPVEVLTWMHTNGYSSFTHSICDLEEMFVAEWREKDHAQIQN